jgi:hypothetical protein
MHRKSSSSSSPIAAKRMTATKTSTSFSSLQSQSTTDNTDNHRSMLLGDVGNQESMVHLLNTAASSNNFSLDRMDEKTSENVIVSVRVRPLSDSELSSYQQHVWDVLPGPLGRISMNDSWRERLRKPINSVEYQYGTHGCNIFHLCTIPSNNQPHLRVLP